MTTDFPKADQADQVFSIDPSLPDGLTLDEVTGVISGIPTAEQKPTDYTITAKSGALKATASLSIEVLGGPLIEPVSQTITAVVGEDITPSAPFVATGFRTAPTFMVRPALPDSLMIDAKTGVVSGTLDLALAVTSYTITASDGHSLAMAMITITSACAPVIDGSEVLPDACLLPVGDVGIGRHGVNPNIRERSFKAYAKGDADVHGPYAPTTGSCASCHLTHTDKNPTFVVNQATNPRQVSQLCFSCHDASGLGSKYLVQAEYNSAAANVVNATTRKYYTHDSVSAISTGHKTAVMSGNGLSTPVNEFGGVLNRHSECTDCHNPHSASASVSIQSPLGTAWTPSGRMTGVSAVKVDYNATTRAPIYTFLDGVTNKATAEYQLCMKCHSSFTTLPSNTGFPENQFLLDKAVEFDPAGTAMHPIEAPGKNQTAAMDINLKGASSFKLWDGAIGETIRCTQCHASTDPTYGAGGGQTAAPHAVKGPAGNDYSILTLPYNRSDSKVASVTCSTGTGSCINEAQYALCFACHSNSPFTVTVGSTINGANSPATNFNRHYLHAVSQGFTCQECHYRLHSNKYPATGGGAQTLDDALVNFAPTVTAGSRGPVTYSRTLGANGNVTGTCTLTCHGEDHQAASFS